MRNWRAMARIVGGSVGVVVSAGWGGLVYIQSRWPMSVLEWIGLVLLLASIVYGLVEFVIFQRGLYLQAGGFGAFEN